MGEMEGEDISICTSTSRRALIATDQYGMKFMKYGRVNLIINVGRMSASRTT